MRSICGPDWKRAAAWQGARCVHAGAASCCGFPMDGYAGDVSLPEAEVAALLDGLLDLRRRIEAARRAPGDYGVEVRCSQATVRYLETTPPPAWPELCAAWREVAFVPVRPG